MKFPAKNVVGLGQEDSVLFFMNMCFVINMDVNQFEFDQEYTVFT